MSANHIIISGEKRSLKHLKPFYFKYKRENAKGEIEQYDFMVESSWHCYTRGVEPEDALDSILEQKNEKRIFCEERYSNSFRIQNIFRKLSTEDKKCINTGKENFLLAEIINDNGERQEYEIYFTIRKKQKFALSIYIQSAYIRRTPDQYRRIKKPIRFSILAKKTYRKEKIPS